MRQPRDPTLLLVASSLVCASIAGAHAAESAADYPVKPVRMIVTFPPGGGTDLMARTIGQKLADVWGKPFVVDNRAGAGGIIGTETAARATPDGYTLLLATSSGLIVNPLLNSKLPYDPFRDFAPVSLCATNPTLLVVHPSVPVTTVKELIAHAKAKPRLLNYATVGQGSPIHLAMALFNSMTATEMTHVPYKGSAPAVTDLVAGQVQLMFNSMPTVLPQVKAGKVRALATGAARRTRTVPDMPTVAESGVPGFEAVTWSGVVAPARTPVAVVNKLSTQIGRILGEPEIVQRMLSYGAEAQASTPDGMLRFMREESARARRVIASAGIQPE
jgi:tripartite-type tricarboxylate transporter receptor subunit TctC